MSNWRRYFAHATLRTTIRAFGIVFSNIYTAEISKDGKSLNQLRRVPIRYGPMSKSMKQSAELDKTDYGKFYDLYPRLTYDFAGLTYASQRQLAKPNMTMYDNKRLQSGYPPAPYDMTFNLHIVARDQLKAIEILEQMLPHFRPNLNVAVAHEALDSYERNLNITLQNVSFDDTFMQDGKRTVVYDLSFSVETSLFGPVSHADIELTKFTENGDALIDNVTEQTGRPDADGNDSGDTGIIVEGKDGVVKRIIFTTLDRQVYSAREPYWTRDIWTSADFD